MNDRPFVINRRFPATAEKVGSVLVDAVAVAGSAAMRAALEITGGDAPSEQALYGSQQGIVSGDSSDQVATANATALTAAFALSVATGKTLILWGQIYVKGAVTLAGVLGTIIGYNSEIIQKDTSHNGLTLSTSTVPYGLRIFGLTVTGQGSATHNAAGLYGRRGDLSYLTSDIILRDCTFRNIRTGISLAAIAKFQTDNVTISGVRYGMDWDSMQTAVCIATRIVSGDGNAASVAWKSRGGNFATRVIGGEYGGTGFARFAELADGAEIHYEACNLEAFSSAQTIHLTTGGYVSLADCRIACTHAATGAVISAAVTGTAVPTIVWRNNKYVSSGRLVEIYGTPTRGPKVFGDQIRVTFAATQGGTATQSILTIPGLLTGLDANVPSAGTSGNGTMFLISPSSATASYSSDTGLDNLCYRYYDNRLAATKVGSLNNDTLIQIWAAANQIQNATTAETDLLSYSIPARFSNSTNETNHIEAFGTTAANENAKTIKVYLGGTAVMTFGPFNANAESWRLEVKIHRGSGGSGQQKAVGVLVGGSTIGTVVKTSETSPTATAAIAAKITGTGVATGDITMLGGEAFWRRSTTALGS